MATSTAEWRLGLATVGKWFIWRRVDGRVEYHADAEGEDRWCYSDAREIARSLNGPE